MLLEGGIQAFKNTPEFGSGLFGKIIEEIKNTTSNEEEYHKTLNTFQNIWNYPVNNKKQPQVSSESYNFNPSPIQAHYIPNQANGNVYSTPLANIGNSQKNSLYDYLVR